MPATPPSGKTEQPPEAVPLESPMPRSRTLDREEPELAQEDDIPSDDRKPPRKERRDAPR